MSNNTLIVRDISNGSFYPEIHEHALTSQRSLASGTTENNPLQCFPIHHLKILLVRSITPPQVERAETVRHAGGVCSADQHPGTPLPDHRNPFQVCSNIPNIHCLQVTAQGCEQNSDDFRNDSQQDTHTQSAARQAPWRSTCLLLEVIPVVLMIIYSRRPRDLLRG